jgi:hypothetical protein
MTPEAKARIDIDKLLAQAGWHVCGMGDFNIHAAQGVAIREFPLNTAALALPITCCTSTARPAASSKRRRPGRR